MKVVSVFSAVVVVCVLAAFFFLQRDSAPVENGEPQTPQAAVYKDLVRVTTPTRGAAVESPLLIEGEARGFWYFEASFPLVLVDQDGTIIAEGVAQAQGDWMTEDFVPFKAELSFAKPARGEQGTLILKKDNPSGLAEHDDALEIPVTFR